MAFNAQIPLSIRFLIDRAIQGHNARVMIFIIAALAAGGVIVSAAGLMRDYFYFRVVAGIVAQFRTAMFDRLQRLSLDYYARTEGGDILSRFSNDLSTVESGLSMAVSWGVQPALDILVSSVLVFLLDWRLALIGLALSPLIVAGPRLFSARTERLSDSKQEQEGRVVSVVQENIAAAAVVRAYGSQGTALEEFEAQNRSLRETTLRLGIFRAFMERSSTLSTLLLQISVIGIAGYMAYLGSVSVGTFVAFQTLFMTLSYSIGYLAQFSPGLSAAIGGLNRVEQLIAEVPKVTDAPAARRIPPFAHAIEFRNAVFSYTNEMRNLDGVSLAIPRGSSVAFVGPSGSGKSTILNLLLRFYDPNEGAVVVDGVDLRECDLDWYRAQTAVVFQENFLFNTSVRENIRLGRPGATEPEIEAAARAAEIHEFILSLPQGYKTACGERGSRFSGGQRQRIAIARAVLRDPSILLLDEATSALDPATEAAVNATFERLARGRTMVSVTHRLRSVGGVDRIFVMDAGRVAEEGTHRELLASGGIYARMWSRQSGVHVEAESGRAHVTASLLAEIPLLAAASETTRAEIATWFVTERYDEGHEIIREGQAGDRMFIIARGSVEVTQNGRSRPLAKLSDGDYFGEMALLRDEARNATVRAIAPCVCLTLQRDHFNNLLRREPALRQSIERTAAARAVTVAQ